MTYKTMSDILVNEFKINRFTIIENIHTRTVIIKMPLKRWVPELFFRLKEIQPVGVHFHCSYLPWWKNWIKRKRTIFQNLKFEIELDDLV